MKLHPSDKDDEWVYASEAVRLISSRFGSDAAAKAAIADHMRDFLLHMKADWIAYGFDVGPLPSEIPIVSKKKIGSNYAEIVRENANIGGTFTWNSSLWERDVGRWKWAFNIFVSTEDPLLPLNDDSIPITMRLPKRTVIGGLKFSRRQILGINNAEQRSISSDHAPRRRHPQLSAPRLKRYPWATILGPIEAMIVDGSIESFGNSISEARKVG